MAHVSCTTSVSRLPELGDGSHAPPLDIDMAWAMGALARAKKYAKVTLGKLQIARRLVDQLLRFSPNATIHVHAFFGKTDARQEFPFSYYTVACKDPLLSRYITAVQSAGIPPFIKTANSSLKLSYIFGLIDAHHDITPMFGNSSDVSYTFTVLCKRQADDVVILFRDLGVNANVHVIPGAMCDVYKISATPKDGIFPLSQIPEDKDASVPV